MSFLHVTLEIFELGKQHTEEETQEQDLPEQQKDHIEETKAPATGPHPSVHDGVPVLAGHDLEDRDEPPSKVVEVSPRDAILVVVHLILPDRRHFVRFHWAPRYRRVVVGGSACRPRVDLVKRVRVLEVVCIGKEVNPHESEDVKHQHEEHEPIPQSFGGFDHGRKQDPQGRRAGGELVQHSEKTQCAQCFQTTCLAAAHVDHFFNDRNNDHKPIETSRKVLHVALWPPGNQLDHHLKDEDQEEDTCDPILGFLNDDDWRVGVQHHGNDIACDHKGDDICEDLVACEVSAFPHRGAIDPKRRVFFVLIDILWLLLFLLLLCAVCLLLFSLEVVTGLVDDS
mmetsp:Transcript_86137/g.223876  ORF Transcript_86137/g.223876 Transcript_86137/m.223876 type:complete len:340 (-) Transcript_86137:1156-2175(-)